MGNIKKRQKRKYLQIWYYPCGYFYPVPVLKILQPPDLCGKSFDTVLQAAIWQLLLSTVKKCQNLSTLPRLFLMPSKYASRSSTFLKKKIYTEKIAAECLIKLPFMYRILFRQSWILFSSMRDGILQSTSSSVYFNWSWIKVVDDHSNVSIIWELCTV